MIQIKNFIKENVPQTVKSLISILRVLRSFSRYGVDRVYYGSSAEQNNMMEKCLVLGNGPSMLESMTDVIRLNKADKIAVNSFATTEYYCQVRPKYYLLLDPVYFELEDDLSENLRDMRQTMLEHIVQKATWNMIIFLPISAKKHRVIENYLGRSKNTQIQVRYFNDAVIDGFKNFKHWMYYKNYGLTGGQTVLEVALYLCLNMGYKSIYLIGADHSWSQNLIVNDANIVCFKDTHFYGQQDIKYQPAYKNNTETETMTMYEAMNSLALVFKGHLKLKEYADYIGASIYNASTQSFIDAYERRKL